MTALPRETSRFDSTPQPAKKTGPWDWISSRVFRAVHGNNLVYNTCWEDPALDREALDLGPSDRVLVITSAGCNALDYALAGAGHVHAVDMNSRQNALLQLKQSAIRHLDYERFFRMFGQGYLPGVKSLYQQKLRSDLTDSSRRFWDKRIGWFDNSRVSFYYRGTSGTFARLVRIYADRVLRIRDHYHALLDCETIEQQRAIYDQHLEQKFWTKSVKFAINRDVTMTLLGVPAAQRRHVEEQFDGKVGNFIRDCVEVVMTEMPIKDNYFWRVYLTGQYTKDCCPEYLKEENFDLLQRSVVDRVTTHTDSVQGFLEKHDGEITRFVLLDHMDWLSEKLFPALESEWRAIVAKASPDARLIWRSGGTHTDFLKNVRVPFGGVDRPVTDLLRFHEDLATSLHPRDRVHTYGSFFIADLVPPEDATPTPAAFESSNSGSVRRKDDSHVAGPSGVVTSGSLDRPVKL